MKRQTLTKKLKILFAAHHFVFFSKETADIAAIIKISLRCLEKLMESND